MNKHFQHAAYPKSSAAETAAGTGMKSIHSLTRHATDRIKLIRTKKTEMKVRFFRVLIVSIKR